MPHIACFCWVAFVGLAAGRSMQRANIGDVEERVAELLSKMTDQEKVAQLLAPYDTEVAADLASAGKIAGNASMGWLNFMGIEEAGGAVVNASLEILVIARNAAQRAELKRSRLGIPASFYAEGLHSAGVGLTIFPMPWTLAASWNASLVEAVYATIASQARAAGIDVVFAPVLNLFADARDGRHEEGFSTDPVISAELGLAAARGLQGLSTTASFPAPLPSGKVLAVAKHFAAYGAAEGGLNAGATDVDERTLQEIYLHPWRAWAAAGGRGAMLSHQSVNRVPMHANKRLVNGTFRGEFGFSGVTISDCNDVGNLIKFRVARDMAEAASAAIRAGLDLDLVCDADAGPAGAFTSLLEALSRGLVTRDDIDRAVGRVLAAKFAAGLFENPLIDESPSAAWRHLDLSGARLLARQAASQSTVALRGGYFQSSHRLPARLAGKSIAVLGPNGACAMEHADGELCDAQFNMMGSYTNVGRPLPEVPTVAASLTAMCSQLQVPCSVDAALGASIVSRDPAPDFDRALHLAGTADVLVLVLGDDLTTCGEDFDRDTLVLPGSQSSFLVQALQQADPHIPILLVLVGGRPAVLAAEPQQESDIFERLDALLLAGRPGETGGEAIADIIFGKAEPGGRLVSPWPRKAGQSGAAPLLQLANGKWLANAVSKADPDGRVYHPYIEAPSTPLFSVGEGGAGGAQFELEDLRANATGFVDEPLLVAFTLRSRGSGDTVVQVYLQDPVLPVVRYWKRLVAFRRVSMRAGQSQRLQIPLKYNNIAFFDDEMHRLLPAGEYIVRVGLSSRTDTLATAVVLREVVQRPSNVDVLREDVKRPSTVLFS